MAANGRLFMFYSVKSKGLFSFSDDARGAGLPDVFSPWKAYGVVRPDQDPPHGLSRAAILAGIGANGYQLWRERKKPAAAANKGN